MFLQSPRPDTRLKVMLSFSVTESDNIETWCQNLSDILTKYSVEATIFFVGKVAEQNPDCVTVFSNKIDIGSQTYNNLDLTSISDYSIQLEEVRNGKLSVDAVGNLDSKVFRAPFGATDQNIYSLLSRNNILVDFSYENQYNVYQNEQFVKIEAESYQWPEIPIETLSNNQEFSTPIILYFDNTVAISEIENLIIQLKNSDLDFVSASSLVGEQLTIRGGLK
jgi:peptidoglycan/xylan/chitin deacetylase (PgdA/CDA1 family)